MPTALRDVRFQGQSGKHMLASSFSGFDRCCRKSRKSNDAKNLANVDFLDYSDVAMLFSVDTNVGGRFSEKRCGPSRRCAQNASAALENFVCYPQKTFSTASGTFRTWRDVRLESVMRTKADVRRPLQIYGFTR